MVQSLNSLRHFEAVARLSRARLAAQELSVSPSAVSQQLRKLETDLGVSLFHRVKHRLVLTDAGRRLYHSTRQAFKILDDACRLSAEEERARSIVVSLPVNAGIKWLGSRVGAWIQNCGPGDYIVAVADQARDRDSEMFIEITPAPSGEDLSSEMIFEDAILPLCAPRLLARVGDAQPPSALLLHSAGALVTWSKWFSRHGFAVGTADGGMRCDSDLVSLQLAREERGIVMASANLAYEELLSGALVPAYPDIPAACVPGCYVQCRAVDREQPSIAKFIDWVVSVAKCRERSTSSLLQRLAVRGTVQSAALLSGESGGQTGTDGPTTS